MLNPQLDGNPYIAVNMLTVLNTTQMKRIITLFNLMVILSSANAQLEYAHGIAATVMNTYPDSMVVKKFLNHLIQDNQIRPGETAEQAQLNRPAVWNYEMSVVLMGFERLWRATHDEKYLTYTKKIIDHFINEDGTIRTYTMDDYNFDNIPAGRQLLFLYEVYKKRNIKKQQHCSVNSWPGNPETRREVSGIN